MKDTIFATDKEGNVQEYKVVFTHYAQSFSKHYVVFYHAAVDEYGAAIYEPNEKFEGELVKIETEEEWRMIEELLADFLFK